MMGPGDGYGHIYAPSHYNSHQPHQPMPMDLHMPQGFAYYRYRNDGYAWGERKPGIDEVNSQLAMNPRQTFEQFRFQPAQPAIPILELRKEKSRDAARSRRGKENYEFYELAKMLPLPPAITSQLDKASIIRLTIAYLRLRDFSAHGDPPWNKDNQSNSKKATPRARTSANIQLDLFEQHQGTHILQAVDGFTFALAADGRFLYVSETVSIYLGLSQVELAGSSVFDYIHQDDHSELAEQLGLSLTVQSNANVSSPATASEDTNDSPTNNPDVASLMSLTNARFKGFDRAFCIRMKSTLTKRGCHFKSSGYRVLLVVSRLRTKESTSQSKSSSKCPKEILGLVALAVALPPPSVHEIRLETDMFVTRMSFDFRIQHCEQRVSELLEYNAEELMDKNLYSLCHGADVNKLKKCHVDLLEKGQAMSDYYRILNKNSGYCYVQTCATIVTNSKNADDQNIVCVNYVISRDPNSAVLDCVQLGIDCSPPVVKKEVLYTASEEVSPGDAHLSPECSSIPSQKEEKSKSSGSGCTGSSRPKPKVPSALPFTQQQSYQNGDALVDLPKPKSEDKLSGKANRKRKADHRDMDIGNAKPEESHVSDHLTSSMNHNNGEVQKRQFAVQKESARNHHEQLNHHNNNNINGQQNWKKNHHSSQSQWESTGSCSSVKDLEQVLTRHFPRDGSSEQQSGNGIDFSTDSLLRTQPGYRTGSAIQWVGAGAQPGHGLPVSALLRQLCASRESVIRANVQAAAAAAVVAARSGTSYYPDISTVQNSLPTPPGSDSYSSDSSSQLMLHKPTSGDFPSIFPYPNMSYDYQSAMTPPSSVSPRDNKASAYSANGSDMTSSSTPAYPGSEPLPFRSPQSSMYGYSHSSPLESQYTSALSDAAAAAAQSQFYPAAHSGFHLYHGSKGTYADPLKNSWYSATS